MSDSPLMTVQEAAEFYRVSAGTIRDWVHKGKLAHIAVGKRYRIVRPELPTQAKLAATTAIGLPVSHGGTRVTNRLAQAGYHAPEDFDGVSDYDLMDLRGIGLEALKMLEESALPITWHYTQGRGGHWWGVTGRHPNPGA